MTKEDLSLPKGGLVQAVDYKNGNKDAARLKFIIDTPGDIETLSAIRDKYIEAAMEHDAENYWDFISVLSVAINTIAHKV